jgi:hypothetical protein
MEDVGLATMVGGGPLGVMYRISSSAVAEWPIPSGFGIMISSASVVFFRQHFDLPNGADVLTLCVIFQD